MSKKYQANDGFSLLELSFALVIMGLAMASFLGFMRISQQKQVLTTTQSSINASNEAIEVFLEWNKKLPCPAPLTATKDNPRHGRALDCVEILKGRNFTSKDYILTHAKDDESRKIVIGRLPHYDLNIPYKDTVDGWGRELYYAVSLGLTGIEDYSQYGGVIKVVDQFDREITKDNSKAQYVLLSAAANNTGSLAENCLENKGPEAENCDEDGTFRSMQISHGTVYYDDILSYSVFVKRPNIADENCDLIEHLSYDVPNLMSIIEEQGLITDAFYIRPGELVTICNKSILRQLNEKQCLSFVCRADNTLSTVTVIR